jgi:NAD(P)H-dependent flavin oxidoreductase YrpB (nitropropane dioxygenase family)
MVCLLPPQSNMLFDSRYPIVAVAMNKVSDLNLAIATHNAGAVPSISAFNYSNINELKSDIQTFNAKCPNAELIISTKMQDPSVYDVLIQEKVSHVEIVLSSNNKIFPPNNLNKLRDAGIKIMLKGDNPEYARLVDGLVIKGSNGAGRVGDTRGLKFAINQAKELYPGIEIIGVGGIGNKNDVDNTLALGADYVGIGTLFAATKESCLSTEAKNKLVDNNSENLSQLRTTRGPQNALVFSKYRGHDNNNNSLSLEAGIRTGTQGHVFAGKGIDSITEIVSVDTLIKSLV